MKITKLFAGIATVAVSVSAMAISSFAGVATYTGTVTLDADLADTGGNMVQITYADLGIPSNATAITNVSFDCEWDCSTAYWAGGGGAVGIQGYAEVSVDDSGWIQKDFTSIPEDYTVTTWSESIDFDPASQDIASVYDGSYIQIGWWWGADPSVEISNITVTYVAEGGEVTTTTTPVVTTTTVAETTTTVAETTTTAAETTVADTTTVAETTTTTTTAATTAAANNSATGVEGVASVVALLTIAGAAVVVAKKD